MESHLRVKLDVVNFPVFAISKSQTRVYTGLCRFAIHRSITRIGDFEIAGTEGFKFRRFIRMGDFEIAVTGGFGIQSLSRLGDFEIANAGVFGI
jgi:hypothetical protein